jgi:hypothetical protein
MFIVLWNSLVEEIIKELTRHGRCCHSGHYSNDDAVWDALYDRACEIAMKHDVAIEKARVVGRQRNRINIPACTVSEYYRRSLYFPFVDHLLVELNDRLVVPKGRFAGQLLIPSLLQELTMEMQQGILDEYESLMPNPEQFFTEIRRWRAKWGIESDAAKPNDLQSTLQVTNRQLYPNIYHVCLVLITMPVTTASAERSFSAMKRVKITSEPPWDRNDSVTLLSYMYIKVTNLI